MENLRKAFFMVGSPAFFVISKLALEIHPPAVVLNLQAFRKQGESLDEFNRIAKDNRCVSQNYSMKLPQGASIARPNPCFGPNARRHFLGACTGAVSTTGVGGASGTRISTFAALRRLATWSRVTSLPLRCFKYCPSSSFT